MIAVKRDRIEYIYEQNRQQAIRSAIPNPIGLLSAVKSGNALQALASVAYMAVDSVTSYEAASTETELQYLQSGWNWTIRKRRNCILAEKMPSITWINMVRENNLPGDYSLNEDPCRPSYPGKITRTWFGRLPGWRQTSPYTVSLVLTG